MSGDSDIQAAQELLGKGDTPAARGVHKLISEAIASLDSVKDITDDGSAGQQALGKKYAVAKLEEFRDRLGFGRLASPSPRTSFK